MEKEFNPNDIGIANGNFFGLQQTPQQAAINLLPVTWDATVSYGAGTAQGPEAILEASLQVDLFDPYVPEAWKVNLGTLPFIPELEEMNQQARSCAEQVIAALEEGNDPDPAALQRVNELSEQVNAIVYQQTKAQLEQGKLVGLVGGDHSSPFGAIRAAGEQFGEFGILHIDAHADLRVAYEGFEYSHASIMYNSLQQVPQLKRLVQVGIRDYCEQEDALIRRDDRIVAFRDAEVRRRMYEGLTWGKICDEVVAALPQQVYISFDIDGLLPAYCGGTGTPVPGGLEFAEAEYLLARISASGKRIIGFDLCEVAPASEGEWDANVGARILFKLIQHTRWSNMKK